MVAQAYWYCGIGAQGIMLLPMPLFKRLPLQVHPALAVLLHSLTVSCLQTARLHTNIDAAARMYPSLYQSSIDNSYNDTGLTYTFYTYYILGPFFIQWPALLQYNNHFL